MRRGVVPPAAALPRLPVVAAGPGLRLKLPSLVEVEAAELAPEDPNLAVGQTAAMKRLAGSTRI